MNEEYNEEEGPTWGDDQATNYLDVMQYTRGPWRDDQGVMNGFDFYHMADIDGLSYFTPNDEDWGAIIVIDYEHKLAEYTSFFEMDDMAAKDSEYKFVHHDGKLIPVFTVPRHESKKVELTPAWIAQEYEIFNNVVGARKDAERKAWDSLGRYKFEMFGYWASSWVKYNALMPRSERLPNPFRDAVKLAKDKAE